MNPITRDSLLTLEAYAQERLALRHQIIAHKRRRSLQLGPHLLLLFEDELTMRYQIQEMLRIERIFEAAAIEEELRTYNALVPGGSEWVATLMIEYPDPEQRRVKLAQLKGIERLVWIKVAGFEPLYALADEDLERENAEKTSAVHFLRFPLSPAMRTAVLGHAGLEAGVDHPNYPVTTVKLAPALVEALRSDLTFIPEQV